MNINPKLKIALIIGAVVVVIALAVWGFIKLKNSGSSVADALKNKQLAAAAEAEINTDNLTLTQVQFNSFSDKLYAAMDGMGTDEEAIYAVFNELGSRSDVLQLIKTFGVKDGETLQEWLTGDLSSDEVSHINQILANKNINYTF